MQDHAQSIFWAAVKAVQPSVLMPAWLSPAGNARGLRIGKTIYEIPENGRLWVIAAGKAASAMARAAEEILDGRISGGLVVTKYGHALPMKYLPVIEAGHPVPDSRGLEASRQILELAKAAGESDFILLLLSGGTSSLLTDIPPNATLSDVQKLNQLLLDSGADIHAINTLRKQLSPGIKGGRLAAAAWPARVVCLIISDVPGDSLSSIASGPTVPDDTSLSDAWGIIGKYNLKDRMPAALLRWLGEAPPPPSSSGKLFERVHNLVIGSNAVALEAARAEAGRLGYHTLVINQHLHGEAREAAVIFTRQLLEYDGPRPACLLMGGETTVTLSGTGKGGRNQEFVLAALDYLIREKVPAPRWPVILSGGTDGTDGPTDAAGAVIGPFLSERIMHSAYSVADMLNNHDAYTYFESINGLLKTGPTQTNVMDLVAGLVS